MVALEDKVAVLNPEVLNPEVLNPEVLNPEVLNPEVLNPEEDGPEELNPEELNPEVLNPEVLNPEVLNPEVDGPEEQQLEAWVEWEEVDQHSQAHPEPPQQQAPIQLVAEATHLEEVLPLQVEHDPEAALPGQRPRSACKRPARGLQYRAWPRPDLALLNQPFLDSTKKKI